MRTEQLTKFENIVIDYQRDVINFLYRLVGNRFEAEDLAQETFIKAFKNFGSLKDFSKIRSWLLSIARNIAVDFFRRKKEKTVALDNAVLENYAVANAASFDQEIVSAELSKEIKTCIDQLGSDDQTMIRLLYYEGFSYNEIAVMMKMNLNTVKSRLHRARSALLVLLKQNSALEDVVLQFA